MFLLLWVIAPWETQSLWGKTVPMETKKRLKTTTLDKREKTQIFFSLLPSLQVCSRKITPNSPSTFPRLRQGQDLETTSFPRLTYLTFLHPQSYLNIFSHTKRRGGIALLPFEHRIGRSPLSSGLSAHCPR